MRERRTTGYCLQVATRYSQSTLHTKGVPWNQRAAAENWNLRKKLWQRNALNSRVDAHHLILFEMVRTNLARSVLTKLVNLRDPTQNLTYLIPRRILINVLGILRRGDDDIRLAVSIIGMRFSVEVFIWRARLYMALFTLRMFSSSRGHYPWSGAHVCRYVAATAE